ncbi:MAG: hypothetical protein OXB88_06485 [Bacteriovoracales bacterium]|nr:hypothetical protein [Bacteriovoracales bacterium]
MISLQRSKIEDRLKYFEAGQFQEFVLQILPLYDSKYEGIVRHGHDIEGKTRAGVPDLLKTFENGSQIACECGTSKKYWHPPKKTQCYSKWKPIEDVTKCLDKLKNISEVVVVSNRPIPTNHPNVKILIKDYFKESGIIITPITSTDLASWLVDNLSLPRVHQIAFEFFNEEIQMETLKINNEKYKTILGIVEKIHPISIIKEVLEDIESLRGIDEESLQQNIETKILKKEHYTSNFQRSFSGVGRYSTHYPDPHTLVGKMVLLLGMPKIGKTNLAHEITEISGMSYKYFCPPLRIESEGNFIDEFLLAIYIRKMPLKEALKNITSKKTLTTSKINKTQASPVIFIIDDAHILSHEKLEELNYRISEAKSHQLLDDVALILISNKTLGSFEGSLSRTFTALPWTANELKKLITNEKVNIIDENLNQYCEVLHIQSGGHPLFALELAKKYPNQSKLISNLIKPPSANNLEFPKKIQSLLYENVLTDADKQNFVQRLSLLTSKSGELVLDAIRTKVEPQITKTSMNLVEEIGPAILEGSIKDGICVSPTFRSPLKDRLSKVESSNVLEVAANTLLTIKEGTINLDDWLDGILYLMMAGKISRSLGGALTLFKFLSDKDSPEKKLHMSYLSKRLFYFRSIKLGKISDEDYLILSSIMLSLAQFHINREEFDESDKCLDLIDPKRIRNLNCDFGKYGELKPFLCLAANSLRLLDSFKKENPFPAIIEYLDSRAEFQHIKESKISYLDTESRGISSNHLIDDFIPKIIGRLSIAQLTYFNLDEFSQKLFKISPKSLVNSSISIGRPARNSQEIKKTIIGLQKTRNVETRLFGFIAESSWCLENNLEEKSIESIEKAIRLIEEFNLKSKVLNPNLYQHMGDSYFGNKKFDKAIECFEISNKMEPEQDSFLIAWNCFKIGLSSTDTKITEDHLNKSSQIFKSIGMHDQAARAQGALASHYLIQKDYQSAIEIGENLTHLYINKKMKEVDFAIAIFMAHAVQVTGIDQKNKEPIHNNHAFLIDKTYYSRRLEDQPLKGGGVILFQNLSQLADFAKLEIKKKEFLKKSIQSEPIHPLERELIFTNWCILFSSIRPDEFDGNEFNLFLENLILCQPKANTQKENEYMLSVFGPFEIMAKKYPEEGIRILGESVKLVSKKISSLPEHLGRRWDIYLNYFEGLYFHLSREKKEAFKYYIRVVDRAIIDKNWIIGKLAAEKVFFELTEEHRTLLELAESNYNLFRCIEGNKLDKDTLIDLGLMMFRLWGQVTWRKLSTKDLSINGFLIKPAQILREEKYADIEAGPIMVALLLKCFNHSRDYSLFLSFSKEPPDVIKRLLSSKG